MSYLEDTQSESPRPRRLDTEIAIVGTGIHGIHQLGRIVDDPVLRKVRVLTIDPFDEPFAVWKHRSENCGMTHLRSPASHGLNRAFPTIRRFARERGIEDFVPPYHRPALSVFNAHLHHELSRCRGRFDSIVGSVTEISCVGGKIVLTTEERGHRGSTDSTTVEVVADSVILGIGNPPPLVPDAFADAVRDDTVPVYHVYDGAFDRSRIPDGDRVAIVGGGIAGAHLALTLERSGRSVEILNRDPFYPAQFDSDPCYIGPRCGDAFRTIDDYNERRRVIRNARRQGSVPPDLYERLNRTVDAGRITLIHAEVTDVTVDNGVYLTAEQNGTVRRDRYDTVILSTGFAPEPPARRLISETARQNALATGEDGFPFVTSDLRWRSRVDIASTPYLYLTGGLAELEIGPPSRNIIGAHLAGRRIVPSLRRRFTPATAS